MVVTELSLRFRLYYNFYKQQYVARNISQA